MEAELTSPMHSVDAESAALGCVLLEPSLANELVIAAKDNWFFDLRNKNIFTRIHRLVASGTPVDIIAVATSGSAADVGGLAYLSSLPDLTPSSTNLQHYIDTLRLKAERRRLLRAAENLKHHASSPVGDEAALESAGKVVSELLLANPSGCEVSMTTALRNAIDEMERSIKRGGCAGLQTGFHALDRMTGGLHAGEMVVLAARPSMGKTALAMNIVEHVAVESKISAGVLSLEMTSTSLMMRMLSGRAGVELHSIRDGTLRESDQEKLVVAAAQFNKAKLVIDDTPSLTVNQLRGYARRMKARHDIKLLVVDYLQLMRCKAENRTQEITQISGAIKAVAKELGIPVLVLSQLSREVEKQDRAPRLSDLRESGAIEQDADLVMMLHRPDSGNPTLMTVSVVKQRNGPTGIAEFEFDAATTRFKNPSYFKNEVD